MLSAEERSIRNGGQFDTGPAVRNLPVACPCSNLRKHGPHIWRFTSDPSKQRICPGVQEDHNV
jgi:hypothetical protein